jgi:transposase
MWGMNRTDLQRLSKDELIELVLRLQRPDKTSRNSSKPPSTDKKEKRENSRPGGAKLGHEPHNRRLADDPDEFRDHMPKSCQACGNALAANAERELIGEYDEIEIPPLKPYVIRHRRFACRCAHCGVAAKAAAPVVATSTPFGPRIHALAIYLKGFQALSYERLRGLLGDIFGLSVSEGALMNMFIRSHPRFERREPFFARPRLSPATRPAFASRGRIPTTGSFTARTRSCISRTIRAPPVSRKR